MTERRVCAPARTFSGGPYDSIPIQKPLWFDDAATSAMGEAFDNACRSLGNFESAVPEIIANRIIAAAQVGEREAARLYAQALKDFGIEDTSMLVVSVGSDLPAYASVTLQPA